MERCRIDHRRQAAQVSSLTTPPNKTQADSQEPEPPKPPANSPLWEKVKHTMDKEDFFRQKSKSAEIQIKRLNREINTLKEKLERKSEAMDAQARRLDTLAEAKKRADQEARRKAESSKHLHHKLQDSQHESKRYRTALAAAFKLIDDLKDKTTLAQLLAQTDQQLLGGAPKREPDTTAAASMVKAEDSSDEEGSRGLGGSGTAKLRTPVKREREREEESSSEDSDGQPLAKTRKLNNGSPRKIILDE